MTQLIAEMAPAQRTAIRLYTREKLLGVLSERTATALVNRPLSPMDLHGQFVGGEPLRARLHTGPVPAGVWRQVSRTTLPVFSALAIWGYAAYRSDSQIDVIRLGFGGGIYTLAELPLGELVAIERRDPMRVRRRSGWLDPPVIFGPSQTIDVAVLSDAGIAADETFTLLGAVAEPAGVRVMPDQANLY